MIRNWRKHKSLAFFFALSLAFVLGGALWAYFALRGFSEPFVLHFDDIIGITQIGGVEALAAAGFVGTIIVAINAVLAMELEQRERFLGRMIAGATLLFALLLFMGFAAIISVN